MNDLVLMGIEMVVCRFAKFSGLVIYWVAKESYYWMGKGVFCFNCFFALLKNAEIQAK